MIHSDWHIHTEASYDAKLPLPALIEAARAQGLTGFGITDHANYNDPPFKGNIAHSRRLFEQYSPECPILRFGVELTPVQKPLYDYIEAHGTREGYVNPPREGPYELTLALTLDEMRAFGMRYAIGAAHWRLDAADTSAPELQSRDAYIREWFRQQMFLIADPRVTVLGHPWYVGWRHFVDASENFTGEPWFGDFRVVPRSMHDEMAAALLQYGVAVECNQSFMTNPVYAERFAPRYAEYLRYLFERGVPVTYGSDCHGKDDPAQPGYPDHRHLAVRYLEAAGFREGDFSEPPELFGKTI